MQEAGTPCGSARLQEAQHRSGLRASKRLVQKLPAIADEQVTARAAYVCCACTPLRRVAHPSVPALW